MIGEHSVTLRLLLNRFSRLNLQKLELVRTYNYYNCILFFLPALKTSFSVVVEKKNVESIKKYFPDFDFRFAQATKHILEAAFFIFLPDRKLNNFFNYFN